MAEASHWLDRRSGNPVNNEFLILARVVRGLRGALDFRVRRRSALAWAAVLGCRLAIGRLGRLFSSTHRGG